MKPARIIAVVLGLVAVQAGAIIAYRGVERARQPPAAFTSTPLAPAPAPALLATRLDDAPLDVAIPRGRVRLIHFWATWCGPCRTELPTLLARAAEVDGLELYAVSVDDDWDVVRAFFPRGVPAAVVRARDPEIHRRYGAQGLPDSYVLAPDGQLVERIAGARDWSRPEARAYLRNLVARAK